MKKNHIINKDNSWYVITMDNLEKNIVYVYVIH